MVLTPARRLTALPTLGGRVAGVRRVSGMPITFRLTSMSGCQEGDLVRGGVPFVASGRIFLPFVKAVLSSRGRPRGLANGFICSARRLFLFCLCDGGGQLCVSRTKGILPFATVALAETMGRLRTASLFLMTGSNIGGFVRSGCGQSRLFRGTGMCLAAPIQGAKCVSGARIARGVIFTKRATLSRGAVLGPDQIIACTVDRGSCSGALLASRLVSPGGRMELRL